VKTLAAFAPRLVAWQQSEGRHGLPWQGTRDPYRVWLSEIMLQQTQVAVVRPYYERFVRRWPDVASLAAASLDDVLAAWSGLGYYGRARNLHRCAQVVTAEHAGFFPRTSNELACLPGIGRSTAAAIAAFSFGERVSILDGNARRVLARVLAFSGDLASAAPQRALWAEADRLLPKDAIEAYTQGLMDLGATLCTRRAPACTRCPVREPCRARREGEPERYPVLTRKLTRGRRESWWLWLQWRGRVWLTQRPPRGVWSGLWTLPLYDDEAALRGLARSLGAALVAEPPIEHALTHFDWVLRPERARLSRRPDAALLGPGRWTGRDELSSLALPAPLRRLLA